MSNRAELEVDLRAQLVDLARKEAATQDAHAARKLAAEQRFIQQRLDDLLSGSHERLEIAMTPGRVPERKAADPLSESMRSTDGLLRVLSGRNLSSRLDTNKSFRQSQRDLFGNGSREPVRRYNLTAYERRLCLAYSSQAVKHACARVNPGTQRPPASSVPNIFTPQLVARKPPIVAQALGSDELTRVTPGTPSPSSSSRRRLLAPSAQVSPLPTRSPKIAQPSSHRTRPPGAKYTQPPPPETSGACCALM